MTEQQRSNLRQSIATAYRQCEEKQTPYSVIERNILGMFGRRFAVVAGDQSSKHNYIVVFLP